MNTDNQVNLFDEEWYLVRYPDVAEALQNGKIKSAWQHYEDFGRAEGRRMRPNYANMPLPANEPQVFAFGAYGTNNVGDEAIFEGIKAIYPNCRQIYIDHSRYADGIKFSSTLDYVNVFRGIDYLILGGGGLLYNKTIINHMIMLAQKMKAVGGRVDLLGVGCEAAREDYYDEISRLVSMVDNITVRSRVSAEIIHSITGQQCQVQNDFAFNLKGIIPQAVGGDDDIPTIGLVTSGDFRDEKAVLRRVILEHTASHVPANKRVRFIHIPHSRSYNSGYNNDCIVGEQLWSSVYHGLKDKSLFHLQEFSNDPVEVLKKYRRLDGVITSRYHGLIFSKIVNIPALCTWGDSLKNTSFIQDHGDASTFHVPNDAHILEGVYNFLDYVRKDKIALGRHLNAYKRENNVSFIGKA